MPPPWKMNDRLSTPWTDEQVDGLNGYQRGQWMHYLVGVDVNVG
jgi:hypothetical protein